MRQQSSSKTTRGQQRVSKLCETLAVLYFVARREYSIDLTHRAIRVLQLAAYRDDPPRIDDVARFLGCALSTASELVKRLQVKGLLVRRRSTIDERVVELGLTKKGRTALTEHTSLDPSKLELGLGLLNAADQKSLVRLIEQMTQGLCEQSANLKARAPKRTPK
jgi:DNA-binding MarR family transcriptional regulator